MTDMITVGGSEPRSTPTPPTAETRPSVPRDPRVDERLQHVDQEVQQHEERREHEDHALEHRDVALEDGEVQQVAGARPREDGLHQHRATELEAELQAEHGDDLWRRVPDDVAEDPVVRESLGAQLQRSRPAILSRARPCGNAASNASGMTATKASMDDQRGSTRLFASASRTLRMTARRGGIALPTCPVTTSPRHLRYCTGTGLSK